MNHLTALLDNVATELDARGLRKLAAGLDAVANTLESVGASTSEDTDILVYLDKLLRHYGNANDPVANMARLSAMRLRKGGYTQEALDSLEKLGALLGTGTAFGGLLESREPTPRLKTAGLLGQLRSTSFLP